MIVNHSDLHSSDTSFSFGFVDFVSIIFTFLIIVTHQYLYSFWLLVELLHVDAGFKELSLSRFLLTLFITFFYNWFHERFKREKQLLIDSRG